jgi:hypothetical protein
MTHLKYSPFINNLDYTGLNALVDDTSPKLGGDLDVNGYSIISVSNGDIGISPNGTGQVVIDGERWPQSDGAANTVLTTNGAGSLSWAAFAPGSFNWVVVTAAANPITIADLTGYIVKGGAQVVFILPAAAALGLNARILGYGNLWTITQNAGQTITLGARTSTAGVGGSFTATMVSDGIELVCVTVNTEFFATSAVGNITIV